MYYTYERLPKEVYDYCITNKIVDAALIAKWKKPGYERLCSTYVINPRNFKFGTVSICRVPKQSLAPGTEIEDPTTGCRGCASGTSHNIFDNKYGQYLAAIQIAREERQAAKKLAMEKLAGGQDSDDDGSDNNEDDDQGPVCAADGSSGLKQTAVWASSDAVGGIPLADSMIGQPSAEGLREAAQARVSDRGSENPSSKKQRHG